MKKIQMSKSKWVAAVTLFAVFAVLVTSAFAVRWDLVKYNILAKGMLYVLGDSQLGDAVGDKIDTQGYLTQVRVGTGTTFGNIGTVGADQLGVEGDTEIDGMCYADGGTTTPNLTLGVEAHKEYVVKCTITTAEVLALNATPDTLIAAPGANYAIIFLDALILLDYNDAAYDGVAAGEDLIISYTDGSGEVVAEIETTGFIDQVNDELRYVTPSAGADGADNAYIIPVANKPLCLSLLTGEIATGTSPIDIVIHYKVVATNL